MLLAERPDDLLSFFQLIAGNLWKEMVLDLIVEPTEPEISEGMGLNILRGEDLLMEKVQPVVLIQDLHSHVIWGERRNEEQAEKALMNSNE
jgi:hypothetical protein